MQIILGINAHHADSSACLIVDGKLIVAIEEERINRKKHYSGFPVESIKACIKEGGVNENEITDIDFNTRPQSNLVAKSLFFLKNSLLKKKKLEKILCPLFVSAFCSIGSEPRSIGKLGAISP